MEHGPNQTGQSKSGQSPRPCQCGCSNWRTDRDMDAENQGTEWDVFPTGLHRSEWSETMKPDLDGMAQAIDRDRAITAMRAAKARCRPKFTTPREPEQVSRAETPPPPPPPPVDYGPPPVLGCPSGRLLGEAPQSLTMQRSPIPERDRAPQHAQSMQTALANTLQSLPARAPNDTDKEAGDRPKPRHCLVVGARLNLKAIGSGSRRPARTA